MSEWAEDQRRFCCSKESIGCEDHTTTRQPAQQFNCQVALDTWETDWSTAKKDWCCKHEKLHCAGTEGGDASRASLDFDCEAGKERWQTEWSEEQKYFCCTATGVSCQAFTSTSPPTLAPPAPTLAPLATLAPYVAPPLATLPPLPTLPPLATLPPPTLAPTLWTQVSSEPWAEAVGREPFDCQAGLSNWKEDWSKIKRDWCCEKEGLGCFDCQVSLASADADWSEAKRTWCCSNENLGCAYDCKQEETTWSEEQRSWCCENVGAGCPALAPSVQQKFESLRGRPLAGADERVAWRVRGAAIGVGLAASAVLAGVCSRAQRLSTYHALRLDAAPQGFLSGAE